MPLTDTKTSATDPATAPSSGPDPSASSRPSGPRPRARGDLGSEPVERLEAEVIDLSARLAAGTYELLVLVGELDHRGSWATWGALSCAAWLAEVSEIDVATARTQTMIWESSSSPRTATRPNTRQISVGRKPTRISAR